MEALKEALENSDALLGRDRLNLMDRLIEMNFLMDGIRPRRADMWLDTPPPEKDPELGIGRYVTWQTPLHRETVRKALENTQNERDPQTS